MLCGEYVVLDGAKAVALPTKLGQSLEISEGSGMDIFWKSFDPEGKNWFEAKYDLFNLDVMKTTDEDKASYLKTLLENCIRLNSDFLSKWKKYRVSAYLGFNPAWGLGSSSTLISCLAQWAQVDPYDLLQNSFGGSGYDIACASSNEPIMYQLKDSKPEISRCQFDPSFKDELYFVYSGQKQDTQEGIAYYRQVAASAKKDLGKFDELAETICKSKTLDDFEGAVDEHDKRLSSLLKMPRLADKAELKDFWGQVKPLGAWGGDFFLATSRQGKEETESFFQSKGFDQIFAYEDLIINPVEVDAKDMA